jgi:hypothetical protein
MPLRKLVQGFKNKVAEFGNDEQQIRDAITELRAEHGDQIAKAVIDLASAELLHEGCRDQCDGNLLIRFAAACKWRSAGFQEGS